jgi:hypothetical protein
MVSVFMLIVIMMSVIMLSVVAPAKTPNELYQQNNKVKSALRQLAKCEPAKRHSTKKFNASTAEDLVCLVRFYPSLTFGNNYAYNRFQLYALIL